MGNSSTMPGWVKNDKDLMRYIWRVTKRESRYPNWRQVYYDCMGLCQYPIAEGEICGKSEGLEYHEIYDGEEKVIQVVLVCNYHHFSIHNGIVNTRRYPSMSEVDIDIEIKLCGSYENWKTKYKIEDREVHYDFEMDNGKRALDLQFDENQENNGD